MYTYLHRYSLTKKASVLKANFTKKQLNDKPIACKYSFMNEIIKYVRKLMSVPCENQIDRRGN